MGSLLSSRERWRRAGSCRSHGERCTLWTYLGGKPCRVRQWVTHRERGKGGTQVGPCPPCCSTPSADVPDTEHASAPSTVHLGAEQASPPHSTWTTGECGSQVWGRTPDSAAACYLTCRRGQGPQRSSVVLSSRVPIRVTADPFPVPSRPVSQTLRVGQGGAWFQRSVVCPDAQWR